MTGEHSSWNNRNIEDQSIQPTEGNKSPGEPMTEDLYTVTEKSLEGISEQCSFPNFPNFSFIKFECLSNFPTSHCIKKVITVKMV